MTDRELLKQARDLIVMCSLIDKSNQCNDMANRIDEQLSMPRVIDLLIAWEQFKKVNWYKSEAIDVEKMLMKQFEAIYNS